MSKVERQPHRVERDREPAGELTAEERQVLARIEKQVRTKRRKPF